MARGYRRVPPPRESPRVLYPGPMAGERRWTRRSRRCSGGRPTRASRWRSSSSSTARSSPSATACSPANLFEAEPAPVDGGDAADLVEHRQVDGPRRARACSSATGSCGRSTRHRCRSGGAPTGRRSRCSTSSRCAPGLAFVEDYVDGESSDVIDMLFGAGVARTTPRTPRRSRCCTRRAPCGATRRARRTSSAGSSATSSPAPDAGRRRRARRRRASSSTSACSARSA